MLEAERPGLAIAPPTNARNRPARHERCKLATRRAHRLERRELAAPALGQAVQRLTDDDEADDESEQRGEREVAPAPEPMTQ